MRGEEERDEGGRDEGSKYIYYLKLKISKKRKK